MSISGISGVSGKSGTANNISKPVPSDYSNVNRSPSRCCAGGSGVSCSGYSRSGRSVGVDLAASGNSDHSVVTGLSGNSSWSGHSIGVPSKSGSSCISGISGYSNSNQSPNYVSCSNSGISNNQSSSGRSHLPQNIQMSGISGVSGISTHCYSQPQENTQTSGTSGNSSYSGITHTTRAAEMLRRKQSWYKRFMKWMMNW